MKKRLAALFLASLMMLSLASCAGKDGKPETTANYEPLTKEDVIRITTMSHPSWPYREDWKVWEYIAEGTGATLEVNAVPNTDVGTKYPLMFASPDTLPDIVAADSKPGTDTYALQGALIAFDDKLEFMPNYVKFVESLSEDEYLQIVADRKSFDGKVYYSPVKGRERSINVRSWMYRKDVFEKHNLKVPETFDELYAVCKELKALYPDSYPYCIRSKLSNLDVTGPSWKPYWSTGIYYDFESGEWKYGAIEDTMLKVLEFYSRMVKEELAPPNFITITTQSWEELITTDRGFIFPEYQGRIDYFNLMADAGMNPDFELAACLPPIADEESGVAMVNKYNVDPSGVMMCNTKDEKRIANAAKYLDWFYTDEAEMLVGWGKEGETYEIVDGKKQFITDENGTQANALYGFTTAGTCTRINPESILAAESESIATTRDMVLEHTMPFANPLRSVALNSEEQKVRDEKSVAIATYMQEMVTKFILGQEPLTKFDEFVKTVEDMGIYELLSVYDAAYNRVK